MRSSMHLLRGFVLGVACALSAGVARAQSHTAGVDLERQMGYVSRVDPGNGTAVVVRDSRRLKVQGGMAVLAGDAIEVTGDAEVEVRTPQRTSVFRAGQPVFKARDEGAPSRGLIALLGDPVRSLLVRMPPAFAHGVSKGGADCAQEAREAGDDPAPLRAVALLANPEQVIPSEMRRVAIAWAGGVPPFNVGLATEQGATIVGRYCQRAVDVLDLSGYAPGTSLMFVIEDSRGKRLTWRVSMIDKEDFVVRLKRAGIEGSDDALIAAFKELRATDPALHLAGYSDLSRIGASNFVAWRLSIAAKTEEPSL